MQNTPTQNTITRFDFNDKMNYLVYKLKFLNEAIICWNEDAADLNTNHRLGFGFIMDDLITEMEECVKNLEE